MEPIEEVIIDVDEEHAGIVVQKLSERRGDLSRCAPPAAAGSGSCSTCRRAA